MKFVVENKNHEEFAAKFWGFVWKIFSMDSRLKHLHRIFASYWTR